ncbi:uncharacterized protein LOC130250374 isoform X2 [Oenanthe melanoleuca]|uniref:uncharacterized protein LOC130250374 isoform X2 n=1 Tax=Oenanthe melanoleuca TaxID=2939378 RepID=UPI0024C1950D|nr:uncharacterized protein LOC130250374 isoform X2 [Oenanthe melanoleuca]
MAGQAQEPVTFEDVMMFLSRAEWDALPEGQRQLYRDVVADTYELLSSLGYPGPKPDILHRLERGEEPWIYPSPGHTGSWLEEPSSGWWPEASGYQEPETSCPGWNMWSLQDRMFQKFDCHKGRSEFVSVADSGVGTQAQPWLVKEEVEDKPELMEDLTQSETFLIHSMMEQQSLDPREQLWDDLREQNHGNTQNNGHTLGEVTLLAGTGELRVEERRAAAAKDHSYCLRNEPAPPYGPGPCSLWEHNYCQQRRARRSRLARQRARCIRVLRRARDVLRRYRPYRRPGLPWRGCSSCCATAAQGTNPGACPATDAAEPCKIRSTGSAEGVTSDTQDAPGRILGSGASPPAPIVAEGMRKGAEPVEDPGANQELERRAGPRKSRVSVIQDMIQDVLKVVGYMLESLCQRFEVQGFSQVKSIWPIVIQIDNLTEIEKP